ncbi:MAG: hypothetical protein MUD16_02435 [Desulfobacterales bacterium]|nr:hypothetical protein [Desulfobacterales bacterium]
MDSASKFRKLDSELENRLDELFRETEAPVAPIAPKPAAAPPLEELKKTVLSIDWEITADALASFLVQIRQLQAAYRRDAVASRFLQILEALGAYIKTSRSQVHPSTFTVLNSVFARLDEVVSTPAMPENLKRKLLQTEMAGYQQLREKIIQRRKPERAPVAATSALPKAPPASAGVSPEILAQAVHELKLFIHAELNRLREELRAATRRR